MARRLLLVVALILSTLLLIARAVPSAASPLEARGDEEPGIVEDSGVDGTDGDDLDVLERRQTCTLVYNYAVRRRLCTKATAPTSYVDISSSNGLFAFMWVVLFKHRITES